MTGSWFTRRPVGDWDLLVAPRLTHFLRWCTYTRSRFSAAWTVWWDPELLDDPF